MQDEQAMDYYRFLAGKQWIADPIQALFMSAPRRALFRAVMQHRPKRVLDVCCGSGAMTARFTKRGIHTVGVDASQTMLERAKAKQRLSEARLMDATQMNFDREFDAAYINIAIHEMAPEIRDTVWNNMLRAVRDGGVIAVMDLNAPPRLNGLAKFWHRFFELDERNFLQTNPEHYANYREFIEHGGIHAWMSSRVDRLSDEKYFFSANLAVLTSIVKS